MTRNTLSNIITSFLNALRGKKNKIAPGVASATSSPIPADPNGSASSQPLVADMFAPRHAATQSISFDTIERGGSVEASSEEWSREGNSLRVDKVRSMVETCSGLVVPATRIKAVCYVSGQYTDEYCRCFRCSEACCLKHIKGLNTREGVLHLCPDCLDEELKNWKTWSSEDGKLQFVYPEKPFSIESALQSKGDPKDAS